MSQRTRLKCIFFFITVLVFVFTTEISLFASPSLQNWMEQLSKEKRAFQDTPFNKVKMPGSHDCGMNPDVKKLLPSPDEWNIRNKVSYTLSKSTLPFLTRWKLTQTRNVATQLEMGSRYLDLRIAPLLTNSTTEGFKVNDTDLYTVHSMYGESMEEILASCHDFLEKNQKEIIVLHFQHFYEMSEASYIHLRARLTHHLGKWLVPNSFPPTTAIGRLQKENKRVFIIFGEDHQRYNDPLYPSDYFKSFHYSIERKQLRSNWHNTTQPQKLKNGCDKELGWFQKINKLWVLQTVLTPDIPTVFKMTLMYVLDNQHASLYKMEEKLNNTYLPQWMKEWNSKKLSYNIVMTDFLEKNMTEQIIQSNK